MIEVNNIVEKKKKDIGISDNKKKKKKKVETKLAMKNFSMTIISNNSPSDNISLTIS